ncbi:LOW QUALITY PROTEIN: hypothetical protein Cgig2_013563 [Carnegiea gigantea]|uniref:DUF4283 domain-containing protein n=1 Tax=Carnegiea gigantea TaxID=171969 RepID=A0A9Q1JHX6_9CARY|nr:LOW QUALITY PROTEIN: hypothetical protein Cgig2_013563 [Carnegiea gigantea]
MAENGQSSADAHPKVESPVSASIPGTVPPQPEPEISVNFLSSYASLIDPNEGTELRYIPTMVVNGIKCARITKLDVKSEISYWQNAILCSVLGANPPLEVMKGFLKCIWSGFELEKILLVKRGVFLIRFIHVQDKITVERKGVCYFDNKPLIIKSWNPKMDLQIGKISFLPLWVQFPDLDIKYWGVDSLSKIRSILGIRIKIDKYLKGKMGIKYASNAY